MPPEFTCRRCGKQFWGLWSKQEMRCPFCEETYTIARREERPKDQGSGVGGERRRRCQLRKLIPKPKPKNDDKGPLNSLGAYNLSQSQRPEKRAVLCGVTYNKRKHKLSGTVNDVVNMKNLLIDIFKFSEHGVRVLTERETIEGLSPTKKNIEENLKWLVKDCRPGDSLVFYFSGHGLQQQDLTGHEVDGLDETICPCDFMQEGMIVDNDINSTIVRPLVEGVTLHAIVDACHSGTILDLQYVYNKEEDKWDDQSVKPGAPGGTSGGLAICLSACQDDKLAADTSALSGKQMNGIMTYLFSHIVRNCGPNLTYGQVLEKMHTRIDELNQVKCHHAMFLRRLFHGQLFEYPLLSASKRFDVHRMPLRLQSSIAKEFLEYKF